ncbi:MAG: hypothetical protein CL878_15045 [Dehalococcoidia bacterium]|nr:hypothetical protein [Dehalococcoidia bacterium]
MAAAVVLFSIGGSIGLIVRIAMREHTRQLEARQPQPPAELTERLERLEARLGRIEERQRQITETQEWQQRLLER